ncbi:MAG: phage portal protein [Actinobacteria bacterium]|nr:phage portal protein [Actinomycetota bacterium]MBI3687244.1 phage portal protein [Actinomycetota bacterium]
MASLLERISSARRGTKAFSEPPFWAGDALRYPLLTSAFLTEDKERIENDFAGYVQGAYKSSGVVFACILARMRVFAQARFQWREFTAGRPGNLFGSPELGLLEAPWPTGTTGNLLALAEADASLAGNFYATTADDAGRIGRAATGPGRRITRMRPDWTTLIVDAPSGDPNGLDAKVVAFSYEPQVGARREPEILLPEEVCHYSPVPDPAARWRGMSWLTPVLTEIRADKAATTHKLKFFVNGATPNLAVKFDKDVSPTAFDAFVKRFQESHRGVDAAYETLFLGGGADPVPLSHDFQQLDFKNTQGAGETRVAAAAGVHPVIVGLSEGLAGSALNAGNYDSAKRGFVDGTMRWLWQTAAASFQTLVTPPRPGAVLWYDDRDIPFLRQDARDEAEIQATRARTIRELLDAGYDPDTVVDAVLSGDLRRLSGAHSGLFSVQLQPAGPTTPAQGG